MPYDEENGTDAADALSKVGGVQKLEFKRRDCKFWLQQVEARMRLIGVRSQWTKMQIVSCMLPDDVAEQVKHLLRVEETDAGDSCYKKVKVYLLELYGDKVEDVFNKASNLTMTSTPSHLARQLIDIMCEKHPTLTECCCTPYLTGLWKLKLPEQVRAHPHIRHDPCRGQHGSHTQGGRRGTPVIGIGNSTESGSAPDTTTSRSGRSLWS